MVLIPAGGSRSSDSQDVFPRAAVENTVGLVSSIREKNRATASLTPSVVSSRKFITARPAAVAASFQFAAIQPPLQAAVTSHLQYSSHVVASTLCVIAAMKVDVR